MIRFASRFAGKVFALVALLTFAVGLASANTYTGTVRNGTNGKVAAGVDVILLNLQTGMETVANTKTDAEGHYQLTYTPTGQIPMLVRAIYKGNNFHAMLPPGSSAADVQIYEPTSDPKTIQFPGRLIFFQPNGANLRVGEEYQVQNQSNPPVTFMKQDGDFEFQTPDGIENLQVSVQGPEKMPVTQGTIDRGGNRKAIAYAFRPGESDVLISYEVPYPSNKISLSLPSVYSVSSVALMVPPTMTISSDGFQSAGMNQGMNVYTHDAVPASAPIFVSVSGTAPPPSDSGQAQGDSGAGDTGVAVTAVPPKLDTLKWVLVGGFAALFFLGAGYLYRKPALNGAATGVANGSAVPHTPRQKNKPLKAAPVVNGPTAMESASPARLEVPADKTMSAVDREVGTSLDQLKDTLFKLELRHQAGTISDQEYAEQRARAEKILRDLVRG
jgi:hypothetical protein